LVNLGVMMDAEGKYEEAARYFGEALEMSTAIARADPGNREKQWSMAQDHAWLADALKGSWHFAEAMRQRQEERSIYAGILAIDDRDARALEGGSVALTEIANLNLVMGRYDLAEKAARSSLEQIGQLIEEDPSNQLWQDLEAAASNRLVEALMLLGGWEEAQAMNREALSRSEALVAADPTVVYWRTGRLMPARWMEIAIAFALGRTSEAHEKILLFKREFGNDPDTHREAARIPWSMVIAMDALYRRSSGDLQAAAARGEELRSLDPATPREALVQAHLQDAPGATPWPANRADQAGIVQYDPALIFTHITGN
jgi:tetratricopeptide (TPR) repeat protein